MKRTLSLLIIILVALTGCNGDIDRTYCNLRARFNIQNAYQAPALYTACQSMGQFCTITVSQDGKKFVFQGSKATDYVNIDAGIVYTGYNLGLCGLIVGLPNIPEMGKTECKVICYDLACPNCWEDYTTAKAMTIKDDLATCRRCSRTYDLNDTGHITQGEQGRPLYRYRVSYVSNALVVNN